MHKRPSFMHVSWQSYGKSSALLAKRIMSSGRKYDLVIGIARGGIAISLAVADILGVRMDIINIKSYNGMGRGRRTKPRILSTIIGGIRGKRILLIDDLIEEGHTMHMLVNYIKKRGASRIDTAVLYIKPWSKFKPDFYVKKVDKWVVFPWEVGEMRRLTHKKSV
jgi:uncharacterized protein